MSTYARPHLTFQQQLELLKTRGLLVADERKAIEHLRQLGYYRLSAYWYPLRKRELVQVGPNQIESRLVKDFQPMASFEQAVKLYFFDKKLRLLLMEAIEHIEVAVRVDIAHHLGAKAAFAYTDAAQLNANFTRLQKNDAISRHAQWLARLEQLTTRSKEDFVAHYKSKHGLPLPIWVSIELWDFGLLSTFYSGMRYSDQAALAERLGSVNPDLTKSWLRTINYLRNIVAHHSRLWNRNMIDQPKLPKFSEISVFSSLIATNTKRSATLDVARPYAALCIVAYWLSQTASNDHWAQRMATHLRGFPATGNPPLNITSMGCPPQWEKHPFWQAPPSESRTRHQSGTSPVD